MCDFDDFRDSDFEFQEILAPYVVLNCGFGDNLNQKKNRQISTLCAAWIAMMPKLNAAKRSKGVAFLDIWA